jgi:tetratricopeptide (TPR) repeat protein
MEESGDKKKRDWKNNFWIGIIVIIITGLIISILYGIYTDYSERDNLKSNIEPLIRKANSLLSSGEFEEAINEYEEILKAVSPKNLPVKYATTQNNLGIAYVNLAGVRDKESNIEKAINAYQEALKIYTVDRYPINYATTQNNLGNAYRNLAGVRDKESNLENAINAYQEALKIRTVDRYPIIYQQVKSNIEKARSQ